MKKTILFLSLVLFLALAACAPPVVDQEAKLGKFAIEQLSGLQARNIELSAGDVKASDTFYFILKNSGTAPIDNIVLESSDSHFVVTPGTIPVLDTSETATIQPIIRVAINHGSVIGGIGYSDLLPSGKNTSTIHIAGTSNGTPVTIDVDLSAIMKRADWTITDSRGVCPYIFNSYDTECYRIANGSTPILTNTGDVPLHVVYDRMHGGPEWETAVATDVNPGGSISLLPIEDIYGDNESRGLYCYIYTDNATFDINKHCEMKKGYVTLQIGLDPETL
jgi:hypothetical protein